MFHALVSGIGQVDLGESTRANLLGGKQVAIVNAFSNLLHKGLLLQLVPAAAPHGGQGASKSGLGGPTNCQSVQGRDTTEA